MHVRIYKIVGIVLSAMLLLASCTNSDLEKKKVKIAYANWLEGIAMSHLAKVVLEEHGYEVELQNADLVASRVDVSAAMPRLGLLSLAVNITLVNGESSTYAFSYPLE